MGKAIHRESQDRPIVRGENRCISAGLCLKQHTKRERLPWHVTVVRPAFDNLDEHSLSRPTLVVLPRGVQKTRSPSERRGSTSARRGDSVPDGFEP